MVVYIAILMMHSHADIKFTILLNCWKVKYPWRVLSRLTQPSCPMKHFIILIMSLVLKLRHSFIYAVTFAWASESRNHTPASFIKQETGGVNHVINLSPQDWCVCWLWKMESVTSLYAAGNVYSVQTSLSTIGRRRYLLYRVTQKNGNFWKPQQKLKKSKKKNYWHKLNHYNLTFKRH